MTPLRTDTDLDAGNVTLLIFLPDALESQLVGPVERWVREQTACAPIARHRFGYTREALERFYSDAMSQCSEEDWQLLASVFSAGPCLASLWYGDGAATLIPAIKGQTHPAHCPGSTVRGRFWCDTPAANLVHVSDGARDMARELGVLRSLEPELFIGPLATHELAAYRDPGPPTPRHSAILTLCTRIATLQATRGSPLPRVEPPEGGDARETMLRAEAWLEQARRATPAAIADAIESYLNGTAHPAEFIRTLKGAIPIDAWEELMLRAGILSRAAWLTTR